MTTLPQPIERLLPQRPPMLLLERLLSCTPTEGVAEALISPASLFLLPDGTVHAAALVELMAQAYAAVHGFQNRLAGQPVGIGYLAGVSSASLRGTARVGDRLVVSVRQTALIKPFVRAQARVARGEEIIAEGELTLFVPPAREEAS